MNTKLFRFLAVLLLILPALACAVTGTISCSSSKDCLGSPAKMWVYGTGDTHTLIFSCEEKGRVLHIKGACNSPKLKCKEKKNNHQYSVTCTNHDRNKNLVLKLSQFKCEKDEKTQEKIYANLTGC